YALIVNGGTKLQLRESFKYMIINVFASALFVVAVAWLYSVTGTLNMAHISKRVAELNQKGVLNSIVVLLFIVFGLKGVIMSFYFLLFLPQKVLYFLFIFGYRCHISVRLLL